MTNPDPINRPTPEEPEEPELSPEHYAEMLGEIARACIDLIGRTGAEGCTIRWADDQEPFIWIVVAEWPAKMVADGFVAQKVAAGLSLQAALLKLCADAIDDGVCQHCHRPSGFSEDIEDMPMGSVICWYQFDPELVTFRRGCHDGVERIGAGRG